MVRIMKHSLVMHAGDHAKVEFGSGMPHPRAFGTFPRFIGWYVRDQQVLSLPEAIRKMTSLPANRLNLPDRGIIKEGAIADIVIFDPDTIIDKATFENPHQYPEGIIYVLVSGQKVIENGNLINVFPGQVLYGPGTVKQ